MALTILLIVIAFIALLISGIGIRYHAGNGHGTHARNRNPQSH